MRPSVLALCVFVSLTANGQTGFQQRSYPANGSHLLTADFNHDGHTDLLNYGGPPAVLLNDGFGGFSSPMVVDSSAATSVAIADFNGDGFPDIALCSLINQFTNAYALNIYLNNSGSGTFAFAGSVPVNGACWGMAAGDVNRDGHADVVIASQQPNGSGIIDKLTTYLGDGTGRFPSTVTETISLANPNDSSDQLHVGGLVGTDFKGNGNFDLLLFGVGYNGVVTDGDIYYAASLGDGHYSLAFLSGTEALSGIPRVTDLNHDGRADVIFTANSSGPHGSYDSNLYTVINNGGGSFTIQSVFNENEYAASYATSVFSGDAADFNGDGIPDIAVAFTESPNPCCQPDVPQIAILGGQGQNKWLQTQRFNTPAYGYGTVAGDFNNDNRSDFVVSEQNNQTGQQTLLEFTNTGTFPVSSCLPDRAGVHFCGPLAGHTYNSPVQFTATSSGITGPVRISQLYVDNKKIGNFPGNQLSTAVALTPGPHTATVVELEYNQELTKSPAVSFSVAGCAPPTSAGVHVCSPASGATVHSPVQVSAAATASSGTSITAMRLYVNNVAKFTSSGRMLNTSIALSPGTYHLSIVAYESNGAALKATESIMVQ